MLDNIKEFFEYGEHRQGASIEFRRFPCDGWPKRFRATIHSAKSESLRAVGFGDTAEEAVRNAIGINGSEGGKV